MARAYRRKGFIRLATLGMLAALLAAGASSIAAAENRAMMNIQFRKVVDLSHVIAPNIPLWPGDPPVEFEEVATLENDGYYLRRFSMGEHSATHMNAPNSFFAGAIGIDGYPATSLVRPAEVIDVRTLARNNPDYVIGIPEILAWESRNGRIQKGSVVLFYTGWQAFWNDPQRFFNEDAQGLHFPGIGAQTTEFLLKKRGIAGVGIDTHGADPGQDDTYATNTQVLAREGIILENLTNLHQLPPKGTTLVIGILRLQQGSGSPVAVMAFAP